MAYSAKSYIDRAERIFIGADTVDQGTVDGFAAFFADPNNVQQWNELLGGKQQYIRSTYTGKAHYISRLDNYQFEVGAGY
ncbi:MAG: hypothetical protein HYV32_01280 [Candidatus Kerfeldbacteria bacterium]|nr:hypothetical protein [Candidatus Kerfeldbacteria bacterium]